MADTDMAQQLLQMINSPEYQAQLEELRQRSKAAVDLQRQGVEENQAYINEMAKQQPGINWAPGVATADFLFGTDFSKAYKAPKSKEERDKELFTLKN